jgi:hypothetical protein
MSTIEIDIIQEIKKLNIFLSAAHPTPNIGVIVSVTYTRQRKKSILKNKK